MLVDDEEDARYLWSAAIARFGFQIITASSGAEALQMLDRVRPDLVLLDLNMPVMNGHQTCLRLKKASRHSPLPVIMLTSSDDLGDKISSFDEGADDYITKEMNEREIEKRIQAVLRRYKQNLDSNPLTRLPGNTTIQKILQQRIDAGQPFAVGYCDLDNFKAYNDCYGFYAGDRLILLSARLIRQAVEEFGQQDDFVGHIGGDDFVFICRPQNARHICEAITGRMQSEVPDFYSDRDRARGFIISRDRRGRVEKFPLVSISIAVVTNEHRTIKNIAEVSKIAGELKKAAKQKAGNQYVFDQRQMG